MKVSRSLSRCFVEMVPLILLAVVLAGCATAKVDWDSRIGSYTRDQAVLDFGPADRSANLTDGTKVEEWLIQRGDARGSFSTLGAGHYGAPWVHRYAEPPSPDQVLRLTFAPDGKLKTWRKVLK